MAHTGALFDHLPNEKAVPTVISKEYIRQMAKMRKEFPILISGTTSIELAFLTGGGVSFKKVNPKTLESKSMPCLYFCGEILDIHGYTCGYNTTSAFVTGHAASKVAAEPAFYVHKQQE